MQIDKYVPEVYTSLPEKGSVSWESPSNIALVKYWGKYGEQLPKNTSLSFTLSNCKTTTKLHYTKKEEGDFSFEVRLDGKLQPDFRPKIKTFFERIEAYLPFLRSYHFEIETSNSFPHSSGIASSASGMSALALCLLSIEKDLNPEMTDAFFKEKASFLSRLGSGSASRSIEGPLVVWGEHHAIPGSSNLYATRYEGKVHPVFENYQDTVLLVDVGQKKVSSTVGHNLMHNHPYAEKRFAQAQDNIVKLQAILANGDLDEFVKLVESEALTLHAMMLTSMPYYILMSPNTLQIIEAIWEYRKATGSKLCFTLDAGANVHLLYPEAEKDAVLELIKDKLVVYCQKGQYLCDNVGLGAKNIAL